MAFVLFVPESALEQLGLKHIKYESKGYFWLALVFAGTLSLGTLLSYFDKKIFDHWFERRRAEKVKDLERKRKLNSVIERLSFLDDREKHWVQYCLYYNVQTLSTKADDVTAQSLLNKNILWQGSGSVLNLPFHIPDDLWQYLQEKKFLYMGSEDDQTIKPILDRFRDSLRRDHWMAR